MMYDSLRNIFQSPKLKSIKKHKYDFVNMIYIFRTIKKEKMISCYKRMSKGYEGLYLLFS